MPQFGVDFRIYCHFLFLLPFVLFSLLTRLFGWVVTESLEEDLNCAKMRTQKKEVEKFKTHMILECLFLVFTVEKYYQYKLSGTKLKDRNLERMMYF